MSSTCHTLLKLMRIVSSFGSGVNEVGEFHLKRRKLDGHLSHIAWELGDMETQIPQTLPEEIEDIILRRIFLVTLTGSTESDSRTIYLETTAAEILSEGKDLRLSRALMERVIIDRLDGRFDSAEPPFQYLVNCYRRAYNEGKDINLRKDMESVVKHAKMLATKYCMIHLGQGGSDMSMLDVSPLLPLIFSDVSPSVVNAFGGSESSSTGGGLTSPPGFLDDLFEDGDYESLERILMPLFKDLRDSVASVSALGNFEQPFRALLMLIRWYPVCAKALVNHPWWLPDKKLANGRATEMGSILGAFFHVSALPDLDSFKSSPNVGEQCFSESSTRKPADLLSSFSAVKSVMNNLYDRLKEVLTSLLMNTDVHENLVEYLGEVINRNASRGRIQVDPLSVASSGMFVNLSAVMLRLCECFLDANITVTDRIDPKYVSNNWHLELRDLTALHASSEEVSEWTSRVCNEGNQVPHSQDTYRAGVHTFRDPMCRSEKPQYSFICEFFFMTARVLNLGLLKAFSDFTRLVQDISRSEDTLATLKAMQAQAPTPHLQQDIAKVETDIELRTQERYCYAAVILRDVGFIKRALSFYRLMVVWLVSLVGGFKIPLPSSSPPIEFAAMPEHFVEDTMEILILAAQNPSALDGVNLDDFMNFIVMFMASPEYIKNSYVRAKMVKVLCSMLHLSGSSTSALFVENQLSLDYLVKNLFKVYSEIKLFDIRDNIVELLEFLWRVPSHNKMWRQIANEESGVYLNFLNVLIDDSMYLLDESLDKLLQLKELEHEMSNTAEWEQRLSQERQFHSLEDIIRIDTKLANKAVSLLALTSEQITAPLLLREMVERVAGMLNYFLLQLVGPERRSLSLTDPEKYDIRPEELLKQIVKIYVHLSRGDKENIFPAAITKDGGSYKGGELFTAAIYVLKRFDDDGISIIVREFIDLAAKAEMVFSDAMDVENPS